MRPRGLGRKTLTDYKQEVSDMTKRTFSILSTILASGLLAPGAIAADDAAAPVSKRTKVITVRQALTDPDSYKNERVLLNGIFMGNNGSCPAKKPVDSSDVMVQDKTGLCIYVSGPVPDIYNASTGDGRGTEITLSGFVKKPEKGRPYFTVPPLPPGTEKPKKKGASAAKKFATLADLKKKDILTVDQALASPDKYMNKKITIVGVYSLNGKVECDGPRPVAPEGVPAWFLKSSDGKQCLWVTGALPSESGIKKGAGGVNYASVAGTLKKQRSGLITLDRAEDKPAGSK